MCDIDFRLIGGQLYKLEPDQILRRYILEHERPLVLTKAHEGVAGAHYVGSTTMKKILYTRLWWPTLHRDSREYS